MSGAMDQDDTDAEAMQQGNVQQQVRKIVVVHNRAVDRDDKQLIPKVGYVTKNLAKVRQPEHALTISVEALRISPCVDCNRKVPMRDIRNAWTHFTPFSRNLPFTATLFSSLGSCWRMPASRY